MSEELPDKLTAIGKGELIRAFWQAWGLHFGACPPKRESVWVLVAQVWLETGLAECHNYNIGNAKSRAGDGYDYQYYACNEILVTKQAEAMVHAAPTTAKITTWRADGKCVIWFYPKHPGCRFRAFRSLLDGVADHLRLITGRYQKAWQHVLAGDPTAYSKAIKELGYYTADESRYSASLLKCYNALAQEPFDYDELPLITEAEKARLKSLAAGTLQDAVDHILHSGSNDDT